MAKIIILTNKDQNFDPADFEISIRRPIGDDKTSVLRKIPLRNRNFVPDVDLQVGDIVGITYKGITQQIDPADAEQSATHTVQSGDLQELTLTMIGAAFEPGSNSRTIENSVDVHLKSFNFKEPLEIKLTPNTGGPTSDQSFWDVINSHRIDFNHYRNFIDDIMTFDTNSENTDVVSGEGPVSKSKKESHFKYSFGEKRADTKRLPFNRVEAYSLLKFATEKYVENAYNLTDFLNNDSDDGGKFDLAGYLGKDKITPYYDLIKAKIREYFIRDNKQEAGFLKADADTTLIELIWSYWYEEGGVNQTMAALSRRFQNIKNGFKDPLLNFALDPLRPLNNILWGYIQDAQHRLTATRRNYEYTSEYDLFVMSTMKPGFNPADRRSKFLQSFHRLIYEATEYFIQSDNTTIRPDGFKLLNALRDTHRIISEGMHNQYSNLPKVARIEMLIEQWILSRSEIREFLGGRIMVPYEEPWMDRVDSMKALQGWDNTSISFYRDLAVYGEKIILGIRYGNWTNITRRDHATNWADAFRDAIQRYIHSYYTVTGIDLSAPNVNINSEEKYLLPGMLIQQKNTRDRAILRRS